MLVEIIYDMSLLVDSREESLWHDCSLSTLNTITGTNDLDDQGCTESFYIIAQAPNASKIEKSTQNYFK